MRRWLCQSVKVCCILLLGASSVLAQVDCPAMGISRPKVNQKRMMGGFGAIRENGANRGPMGDYFSSRTTGPRKFKEHNEFAAKGGRGRFFRDMDEFATKRQGSSGEYRSFDEFSRKGSKQGRYRDFDEFSRKANSQTAAKRRGGAGKASRGFHRGAKRVRSQDSRASRGRNNRGEYSPFSTTLGPTSDEIKHREPQMGLWGGTIGKRGGKEKRKMVPMPNQESDKEKE
jgi:hypothetical protein